MKTTLDLPDDLVQRIKIKAVQARKPLKHFVAELLSKGLDYPLSENSAEKKQLPKNLTLNERGFPVFRCGQHAPAAKMTAEELIALEQQAVLDEDLHRAGLTP